MFTPSPQQSAFLDWVSTGTGSCVLEAVAGAGKTTTLLEAVERTGGGVAILAYNKKIAEEISAKLKARGIDWKTAEAGTVHSFGFRAYRKAFPDVIVDSHKVSNILGQMYGNDSPLYPWLKGIAKMVGLAKQRALGVLGRLDDASAWHDIIDHFDLFGSDDDAPLDDLITAGQRALLISNRQTGLVDFDDMVYLPLIHRVRFWRYRWLFVDEAQDTNPARRALVRALLAPGGRCVAVGDRHQAIYGFTGADGNSLDLIAADHSAIRLPLTTTYRCPKSVVAFSQRWVSHIQAHDSAPDGAVSRINLADMFARDDLHGGSAVLCRLNAPLVSLAFDLIRRRIPCKVEGREIGKGLVALATKWKRVTTLHGLETHLADWADRETTKALAKRQEMRAQQIADQRDTLQVIIDDCRKAQQDSIKAVVASIEGLFDDNVEDMLTLSSIHKSKGREWDTVLWLDRAGTCPSKFARQAWQREQEINLCYVAATRAKRHLIDVVV